LFVVIARLRHLSGSLIQGRRPVTAAAMKAYCDADSGAAVRNCMYERWRRETKRGGSPR